ncbi:carbohydrate ABC transporter substrate-binding protein [Paenibacillus sp. HN-1]|uniref:ABC transporter substrate-binding protein n=2 Tax=Paenibacillus TaxID=44249 RepID=UPI001CA933FE|nr:ABC transporter substrate-binding protein [Paenibacillus sp. CGMCC 1.18879]MBY9078426.1 carbohydrate ABC transporter substrate-binding protein [Paenibacillus sp. CGMCC 1.18879]MBY9087916.1 carbohydrate ABC transporter substrate-binding protein [Paenibacillus sinensis]
MRNMRSLVLAALLGGAAVLSGCSGENTEATADSGGSSSSAVTTTTIDFMSTYVGTDLAAQWFKSVFDQFKKDHGDTITVNVEDVPGEQNYVDKFKLLLSTEELPDVGIPAQNLLDMAVEAKVAVDLTPYMDANPELKAQFTDESLAANTYDGKVYGLPNYTSKIGYFYNKSLFEKAGISAPATTWDEFFEQLKKLKEAGITPLSLDTADTGWITSLWFNAMIGSSDSGAEFMNTKYPTDYNRPEVVQAFGNIQNMLQNYTTTDAVGAKYDNAATHFLNGETAMIANGTWMIGNFSDETKSIPGLADQIGVALFPEGTLFETPQKGYFIMAKDKAKQDAAFEFIKALVSNESQEQNLMLTGQLPLSPQVKISEEAAAKYPLLTDLEEQSQSAKHVIQYYQKIWYNNVCVELSNIYPALALGDMTPEEAAQRLTETAQQN